MTRLIKALLNSNSKLSEEIYEKKAQEIIKIFKRSTSEQLRSWKFPISPESWGKNLGDNNKDVLLQSRSD